MSSGTVSAPDRPWGVFAWATAAGVAAPLAAVAIAGLSPAGELWTHLATTVLPRYIGNTFWILLGVGVGTIFGGVGAAWLVSLCRFPGRRVFEWAQLLPLAMPAYVVAYAYAGLFDAAGPVHAMLRDWLGSVEPIAWYPNIRSLWGAAAVLTLVLYPYVYMLARAAFLEQSVCVLEVSRTLGLGVWRSAWRVALPLARPSIVVGTALALMEALNDFGAVAHFGVDTFTTGIYRVWLARGDVTAAAQLAMLLVLVVAVLLWLERSSRGRAGYMHLTTRYRPLPAYPLRGANAAVAVAFCFVPVLLGFLLPAGVLALWSIEQAGAVLDRRFASLVVNSFTLAGGAALLCTMLGGALAYAQRQRRGSDWTARAAAVAGLGYAMPGAVIAVGVVLLLGGVDRAIGGLAGIPLLLLSGGLFALFFAYTVRFLPIGIGTVGSGLGRITQHMDDAARTLGFGPSGVFRSIHVPMVKGSVATAALLVFVDVMKELPATLMIRPFNFDTLAIRTYEYASDEQLAAAAPTALAIAAVGIIPVILLSRAIARSRPGSEAARREAALVAA